MTDTDDAGVDRLWPGDLQLDDELDFDGTTYVVVGTGSHEATLEPKSGDENAQMRVFKWAITESIGIELETTVAQERFEQLVHEERGSNAE